MRFDWLKFFIKVILLVGIMVGVNAENDVNLGDLPTWDLSDLYASREAIEADMEKFKFEADRFVENYKDKVEFADVNLLVEIIEDYEKLDGIGGRLGAYAMLAYSTNANDESISKLYQEIQEFLTNESSKLIFFSLDINKISDEKMEEFLSDARVGSYKEWFKKLRQMEPYQLSEPQEMILNQKSVTSHDAWVRLFDETLADLQFTVQGEEYTSSQLSKFIFMQDEELRKESSLEFARVLKDNSKLFTTITNTLAKEKAINDELRGIEGVMKVRNLSNGIEDEVVDNLLKSVQEKYKDTSHRYFEIKAKLMGKEKLQSWDRSAPLPGPELKRYSWDEARDIVLEAYSDFSPKMAELGQKFFDEGWIDAPVRDGKRSGAFLHPTVVDAHPYLLVNYQGFFRDVTTLAHELGHGVHFVLSARHGDILNYPSLTLAETASIFGEQLAFRKLLDSTKDEKEKIQILASKIEGMIGSVVTQTAFCLFEKELHERRKKGELSEEEISEIWLRTQQEYMGDYVELGDHSKIIWSYIHHFIHFPFYVYSYAFGDCLVNSLYMAYRESDNKEQFANDYLDMLAAGGSEDYLVLLEKFSLNPKDPDFWKKGMGMIEELIDELESLL